MKIKGGSGIHCLLSGLRLKEYRRSLQVQRCFSPTRFPHALLRMVDNASQQTVMCRLRHKAVIIIVSLCNEVGSASLMSSDLYACLHSLFYATFCYRINHTKCAYGNILNTANWQGIFFFFFAVCPLSLLVPLGLMFTKPSTLHKRPLTRSCL